MNWSVGAEAALWTAMYLFVLSLAVQLLAGRSAPVRPAVVGLGAPLLLGVFFVVAAVAA